MWKQAQSDTNEAWSTDFFFMIWWPFLTIHSFLSCSWLFVNEWFSTEPWPPSNLWRILIFWCCWWCYTVWLASVIWFDSEIVSGISIENEFIQSDCCTIDGLKSFHRFFVVVVVVVVVIVFNSNYKIIWKKPSE